MIGAHSVVSKRQLSAQHHRPVTQPATVPEFHMARHTHNHRSTSDFLRGTGAPKPPVYAEPNFGRSVRPAGRYDRTVARSFEGRGTVIVNGYSYRSVFDPVANTTTYYYTGSEAGIDAALSDQLKRDLELWFERARFYEELADDNERRSRKYRLKRLWKRIVGRDDGRHLALRERRGPRSL